MRSWQCGINIYVFWSLQSVCYLTHKPQFFQTLAPTTKYRWIRVLPWVSLTGPVSDIHKYLNLPCPIFAIVDHNLSILKVLTSSSRWPSTPNLTPYWWSSIRQMSSKCWIVIVTQGTCQYLISTQLMHNFKTMPSLAGGQFSFFCC